MKIGPSCISVDIASKDDILQATDRILTLSGHIRSVCICIRNASIVSNAILRADLFRLLSALGSSSTLKEVILAFYGSGKARESDEDNHCPASAISEVLSKTANLSSIELAIPRLLGDIQSLATSLSRFTALHRVVIHQCNCDGAEGILPLLNALTNVSTLQALVIEGVKFQQGCSRAAGLLVGICKATELSKLELKHCNDLSDEHLMPLFHALEANKVSLLKQLKISNGIHQQHGTNDSHLGTKGVQAVAQMLRSNTSLEALMITTLTATSLRPVIYALEDNSTLKRIQLYNGNHQEDLSNEMARVLVEDNFTLEHCNRLGGLAFGDVHFYTHLNRLGRRSLWKQHSISSEKEKGDLCWIQALIAERENHRVVHYLLTHYPSLLIL